MELLSELLHSFDPAQPHFRPTEIYNESWLVKIVLQQTATIPNPDFPLGFLPGADWFSEGLLPSAFQPRFRGDSLGESRTNADGTIGHFIIGQEGKADLELSPAAAQFTIVEAKVGAPLSRGTANAPDFDQAARNIACLAEVLHRAGVDPAQMERLSFLVLAPEDSIRKGTFRDELDPEQLSGKVKRRVAAYEGELDEWFQAAFQPTFQHTRIESLSWEDAIQWIGDHKPEVKRDLLDYYSRCLHFN